MDKVRFACPRCQTIMQTGSDKIGYDVACPHCTHRFKLVETRSPKKANNHSGPAVEFNNESTIAPKNPPGSTATGSGAPGINGSERVMPAPTTSFTPNTNVSSKSNMGTAQVIGPAIDTQPNARFQCPYCQTRRPPIWKSEISQTGWFVFVVLLLTTCFLCVIGLFIRDKYRECSQCKIRLG